jgi:hypothetical protein
MSISHSLNTRTESCLKLDPLEEFKASSLEFLTEPGLEDDAQFFIEEANFYEPGPLDEFVEPHRLPIELKPLPIGLRYAFLDNDGDSRCCNTPGVTSLLSTRLRPKRN